MSNIIEFRPKTQERSAAATPRRTSPAVELPLDDGAPAVEGSQQLAKLFSDSFFKLPFVTLPSEECATWGEFWEHVDIWNDSRPATAAPTINAAGNTRERL
jgi:hypothetical protein